MILLAVDDSYEITDDNIDQSKAVYVSNVFKKLVVKDNFLDEESKDAIDPVQNAAIDTALENLEANRLALTAMADNAITAAESAQNVLARCEQINRNLSNAVFSSGSLTIGAGTANEVTITARQLSQLLTLIS